MEHATLNPPLETIVKAAQMGDQDALASLVSRFQNMAYGKAYAYLGNHQLAQDAVQEAFWEACSTLSQLRNRAAFPGWFGRIVHKQADRQARRYRYATTPIDDLPLAGGPTFDPQHQAEKEDTALFVHDAIQSLTPAQRDVTILYYLHEYSYQEISDFLDIPTSAVKKRLFVARQRLKERLIMSLEQELQTHKPSNDDLLAAKLQLYPALRANDTTKIKKVIAKWPEIMHAETAWPIAANCHYWPLGVTPLYWAAGLDQQEVVNLLLAAGADINGEAKSQTSWHRGMTPLQHAVILHQPEMVQHLIERGAELDRANNGGLTPLHLAVIRQDAEIARRLITAGANQKAKDKQGLTPADWAKEKGDPDLQSLFGINAKTSGTHQAKPKSITTVAEPESLLGRVFDGDGHPLDKRPAAANAGFGLPDERLTPTYPILTTGIKIIDLFAPLKRGGSHGIFTPLSGIGRMAIQAQIMRSVINLHGGMIVTLTCNNGEQNIESTRLKWQGTNNLPTQMLNERIISIAVDADGPNKDKVRAAVRAAVTAEALAQKGHEVLLLIEYPFGLLPEVVALLESHPYVTAAGAVTRLYDGDFTAGQAPAHFDDLDAIISFSLERGRASLWPAVDPASSQCVHMGSTRFSSRHRALAAQARQLLQRYAGLHHQYEHGGNAGLFFLSNPEADEKIVAIARRLNQYLVQPMVVLETTFGIVGQYAELPDVLNDVEAILAGQHNDLPEETLRQALTLAD